MEKITVPWKISAKEIAASIFHKGYGRISSSNYIEDSDEPELNFLKASYFSLPKDENGGQRFRTYKQIDLIGGDLIATDNNFYLQSQIYNPDLGGISRLIPEINKNILELKVFQKILSIDISLAKEMEILKFDEDIKIGLHQVRYAPAENKISFSSPPALHKDEEDIVFIHIVNLSPNLIGGENIICDSATPKSHIKEHAPFIAHIKLVDTIEALCVTKKFYHQVTPMSVQYGKSAFRDILLVTFEKK